MRKIGKHPIEIFGVDFEGDRETLETTINQQYCRFLKETCVKPRKSQPYIKVGICTLGATVCGKRQIHPVIICPQRFKEESVFETIRQKYLSHWRNIKWVQEVNIGVGGSVDYVAVEVDRQNARITDFLCVEIQAGGTTGSPFPYIEDLKAYGKFTGKHSYGINWANEFSKTMMQQAYKKGKIVEHWNRKIVFVLQDVAVKYLMSAADCSKLTESDPKLPVDFCTFSLNWVNNEWKLCFDAIRSTSIDGINTILGGAKVEDYLTEKQFINNIIKKGQQDGVFAFTIL